MSLKVLSIGFFGHQNAGDDLLRTSLEHVFREHRVNFSCWEPSARSVNEYDLMVVGGGSLWPDMSFFRHTVAELKRLRKPYCVLGISAKRLDRAAMRATRHIVDNALFFHVRDSQTKQMLGGSDRIRVGADLFWWAPWVLPQDSALAPSANEPQFSAELPRKRVALAVRSTKGQDWALPQMVAQLRGEGFECLPFPFYFGSVRHDALAEVNDAELLAQLLGGPVTSHWSCAPLLDADIVLAMRYHAVLVSVRMGRVVIGLDCHPKIGAFFADHGLQALCVQPGDSEGFTRAWQAATRDYALYQRKFLAIRDALERQGDADRVAFEELLQSLTARSARFAPW